MLLAASRVRNGSPPKLEGERGEAALGDGTVPDDASRLLFYILSTHTYVNASLSTVIRS